MTKHAQALMSLTVGDIMQQMVRTVRADTRLSEVARLLWDEQVSGVPVVDEAGRPVGFVSTSDIARFKAFGPRYRAPAGRLDAGDDGATLNLSGPALPVPKPMRTREATRAAAVGVPEPVAGDIMMPATFSVRRDATVHALARFLTNAAIHRALVVEDGRLLGIVSVSDVVEALAGLEVDGDQPPASAHTTAAGPAGA